MAVHPGIITEWTGYLGIPGWTGYLGIPGYLYKGEVYGCLSWDNPRMAKLLGNCGILGQGRGIRLSILGESRDSGVVHIAMCGVVLSTKELWKFLANSRHYWTSLCAFNRENEGKILKQRNLICPMSPLPAAGIAMWRDNTTP